MEAHSRYSAGLIVPNTSMAHAISALETVWISPFWISPAVLFDPAFHNDPLPTYLNSLGIHPRPIPPQRHNKNVLESKHKVIRDISERLKHASSSTTPTQLPLLIQQSLRICNDLYGNDLLSAYELAKGFTRPVISMAATIIVPDEIVKAHQALVTKRKLTLILRSKATTEMPLSVGDMVQVFVKHQNQKRGHWFSAKPVLSYDLASRTVTVLGANGRKLFAAIKDTRPAVSKDELAATIQDALDGMHFSVQMAIDDTVDIASDDGTNTANQYAQPPPPDDEEDETPATVTCPASDTPAQLPPTPSSAPSTEQSLSKPTISTAGPDHPSVGASIEIYWPLDKVYYPRTVTRFTARSNKHTIRYDDGGKDVTDLKLHTWRYTGATDRDTVPNSGPTATESEYVESPEQETTAPVSSSEFQLSPGQDLVRTEEQTVAEFFDILGSKEFMLHQAQGMPPFVTENAYSKEEIAFKKTVREVPVSQIPDDANFIRSHVFYKIKRCDDDSFVLKSRIAPHGNEDKGKHALKTDSATCPPVGIHILFSIASIRQWVLAKIDFKSAFLQTGFATREVCMVQPRECTSRYRFYWLLLTAAYGFVNASAKWQQLSDNLLRSLGFLQLVWVPQLFYRLQEEALTCVTVKVVEDVLFAAPRHVVEDIISLIQQDFQLGTIVFAPGTFQFYGLTVTQYDEYSVTVHGEDKFQSFEPFPIDRTRRRKVDEPLNQLKLRAFWSLNSSIGWLSIAASPFCAIASSLLQQKGPYVAVKHLVSQFNVLCNLKKRGTCARYHRPPANSYPVSLLAFADASRTLDHGQLGFVTGLLFGEFTEGSVFHPISWS
ncbi:hypothetical protein BWQ96_08672 [Gracilariopsis chorda]|uniref:Reverse transcriptase Ty1/copia-type domain-containing protein n=1 Tax=Gracilariopsis chorda TaxID=448386 RepID=A0A2V3IHN8_9FLOR|nr:hypothetical protein BWQ96_08672 [Gracilariopsis chorda]|eukprot:PXF41606.1 hypothetical protein BWQ96_08672 [Gracilariopsis chorda]